MRCGPCSRWTSVISRRARRRCRRRSRRGVTTWRTARRASGTAGGQWGPELGDDEGALSFWGPVLAGTFRCSEEPHRVLGCALLPLLRTGQLDEARGAFLRGYSLARRNINLMAAVGQHVEFCALTGNEARGLEMLAEHQGWLADRQASARKRLEFIGGVTVLLRRLIWLGYGSLPVGAAGASGTSGTS